MKKLLGVFVTLSFAASVAFAAPAAGSTTTTTTTTKPTTTTTKPAATTTTTKPAATTTKPTTATTTTKPAASTTATKPAAAKPATATKPAAAKTVKPYVDAGDMVVNAGLGYSGYYGGYGLAAGFELAFAKVNVGILPLTFGASARGAFTFGGYNIDTALCGAAMASAHLGLRGVKIPTNYGWASNFDTYMGLGLGLTAGSDSYWTVTPKLSPAFIIGETYYFEDKLGVNFEYGYLGRIYYSHYGSYTQTAYYASVGLVYKL